MRNKKNYFIIVIINKLPFLISLSFHHPQITIYQLPSPYHQSIYVFRFDHIFLFLFLLILLLLLFIWLMLSNWNWRWKKTKKKTNWNMAWFLSSFFLSYLLLCCFCSYIYIYLKESASSLYNLHYIWSSSSAFVLCVFFVCVFV